MGKIWALLYPAPPRYGFDSSTTVLREGLYAIKRRNQTKPNQTKSDLSTSILTLCYTLPVSEVLVKFILLLFLNDVISLNDSIIQIEIIINRKYTFFFSKRIYYVLKITIFTNPSARAGYDTSSIFKRSLTDLNSEFSFSKTSCLTKAEEPSLSNYLPIAGGRIIGFIPFSRVLVLCEMQSISSRIWTRVSVSISYNDNHYTTGTSVCFESFARKFLVVSANFYRINC